MSSLKGHGGLVFICLLFLASGILRLNDLSLYTPDSTRYVIWGNSLAQGKGFLDATQPDPNRYVVHAPLYSVLLAPAEFFFPLSLIAVKVWTLLWGILAVVLLYVWILPKLGKTAALIGALALSFNPLMLLYSSEALSESPFIAFVLLAFILAEKMSGEKPGKRGLMFLLVTIGAVALLREVGVAMVIAVVAYFIFCKQPRRAVLVVLGSIVVLGLWYVRNQILVEAPPGVQRGNLALLFQHFVTPPDVSIVNELALRMWLNFKEYASQLGGMLFYSLFASHQTNLYAETSSLYKLMQSVAEGGTFVITLFCSFLMFSGIYIDGRRSKAAFLRISFVIIYLGAIFSYPVHDIRFLVPVLPLMIYYVVLAVRWYVRERGKIFLHIRREHAIGIATVLMIPNFIGVYYLLKTNIAYEKSPVDFYQSLQQLSSYPPIFTQPWTLLGRWVQQNIPEGETIATPSKELSIVVGNRKVKELDPGLPLPLFEKLLRDNRIGYILAPIRWQDLMTYEFLMMESSRFWFEPVHRVSNLILLKVHSRYMEPDITGKALSVTIDTTSASGLLRAGRQEIVRGNYDAAIRWINKGIELSPEQPQLIFQLIIAYSQKGDAGNSMKTYRRFITLPQVGSYIVLARFQVQAMELVRKVLALKNPEERSVKLLDAASTYWNSGYYRRASSIIDADLDADSLYFSGLLWGFHYAFQQNDTSRAFRCLRQLQSMDTGNTVVNAFARFPSIYDSLHQQLPPSELSRLHLDMAAIYRQIDLREEALDEAEKAIGADRTNTAARLFIAESFERGSLYRSARQVYKEISVLEPENMFVRTRIDSLGIRLSFN